MSKKVLIVDDDASILEVVKIILDEEGYETFLTSTEDGVFDEIKAHQPDLILLDILLSGVDGREICKKLKSNAETKAIPVLMMSADTSIEQKAGMAGANGFIKKPFDMYEFLQTIEKFLKPAK